MAFWGFAALAAVLVSAGIVIPGKLEQVERVWMSLAHAISRVTTPIFMAIVYFVVLTPVGLVRRLAGRNALVHHPRNGSYWIRRPVKEMEKTRRQMERQF
jgi:6,7-dimethyl-8-ribityllumazine synthase